MYPISLPSATTDGCAFAVWCNEGARLGHPEDLRRLYDGPIDRVRPTFYISPALGEHRAHLVRDLIGGDRRFFPPEDDMPHAASIQGDHNYNDNQALVDAIRAGHRGAYWDILRRLRT